MSKKSSDAQTFRGERMVFRGSEYTIDVDADGDIVLTRKRGTGDSHTRHADRLRALNNRNADFWRKRNEEE